MRVDSHGVRPIGDFQGKVVIVTGASSGIGRAIAEAFGAAGAHVALVARSANVLQSLALEMEQRGDSGMAFAADVTDRQQVAAMVTAVATRWGRIDILVNNAGIGAHGPFLWTPYDDFERIMRVNMFGVAYCTSAVLPYMIEKRSGKIVNISSIIGKSAFPGNAAYCASKFALEGFAESLRVEVVHHGIRVIQICPGLTETAFFDHLLQTGGHRRPERRLMPPAQVAGLVLDAVRRNRRSIVIGMRGKVLVVLDKFFKRQLEWILRRRVRQRFARPDQRPEP